MREGPAEMPALFFCGTLATCIDRTDQVIQMPLARAKRTFQGRYGMVRAGNVFNCEPGYFADLKRNGLVEEVAAAAAGAADPGPSENASIPDAPARAGKELGAGAAPTSSVPLPAAGSAVTSRSLRRDLASRAKTSKRSESGETPEKKDPGAP